MTAYRPAKIFAALTSEPPKPQNNVPPPMTTEPVVKPPKTVGNEIQVNASSELSLEPDRCKVTIFVNSKKEHVQDVKNSVSRRSDYIIQVLYNYQVKEDDITTSKVLTRVDGLYHINAEISVVFSNFKKCQTACNFLVEKLDENVKVSTPEFFHSPQRLENLRRQASLTAVSNARQKAAEIARFLQAHIGRPLAVREEAVSEWEGSSEATFDADTPLSLQQRIALATVYVNVKCSATFELRAKGKSREAQKE